MIPPQVDYVGRPTRQYVDVMDTTQMPEVLTSGMISCKGASRPSLDCLQFFRDSNLFQNRANDEDFIRRLGEVSLTSDYNHDQ